MHANGVAVAGDGSVYVSGWNNGDVPIQANTTPELALSHKVHFRDQFAATGTCSGPELE
jgi:hypothetical protein